MNGSPNTHTVPPAIGDISNLLKRLVLTVEIDTERAECFQSRLEQVLSHLRDEEISPFHLGLDQKPATLFNLWAFERSFGGDGADDTLHGVDDWISDWSPRSLRCSAAAEPNTGNKSVISGSDEIDIPFVLNWRCLSISIESWPDPMRYWTDLSTNSLLERYRFVGT